MQTDSLPQIFNKILKTYSEFIKYDGSSMDSKFQALVSAGCTICQEAVKMVNELELFSKNETLDDLSSASIRYLTLPAFLGFFTTQKLGDDRLSILHTAETLYRDFMTLVNNYEIPNIPISRLQSTGNVDFNSSEVKISQPKRRDQATLRDEKVKMFKEKKALEKALDQFDGIDLPNVDDEVLRDTSLSLVRYWAYVALEELRLLGEEISIISQRSPITQTPTLPGGSTELPTRTPTTIPPNVRPPLLITKDKIRAAVFGAGYPSVPTMTLDQFYQLQVKQGILPPPGSSNNSQTSIGYHGQRIDPSDDIAEAETQKAAEEDAKTDAHCPVQLAKARAWDEFKDENRRGSGNRMNRG